MIFFLLIHLPIFLYAQNSSLIVNTNPLEDYKLFYEEYHEINLLKHFKGFNISFSVDSEQATVNNNNEVDEAVPNIGQNKVLVAHGNPDGILYVLDVNRVMTIYNLSKKIPDAKNSSVYIYAKREIEVSPFVECFDFILSEELGVVVDCYNTISYTNYFFLWNSSNAEGEVLKIKNTQEKEAINYGKRKLVLLNESSDLVSVARAPIRKEIKPYFNTDELLIFDINKTKASVTKVIGNTFLNLSKLWILDFDSSADQSLFVLHGEDGLLRIRLKDDPSLVSRFSAMKMLNSFAIIHEASQATGVHLLVTSDKFIFLLYWTAEDATLMQSFFEKPSDPISILQPIALREYWVLAARTEDSVQSSFKTFFYAYEYDSAAYFHVIESKSSSLGEGEGSIGFHASYNSLVLITKSELAKFIIEPPVMLISSKGTSKKEIRATLMVTSLNSFSNTTVLFAQAFNITFFNQTSQAISGSGLNTTLVALHSQNLEFKLSNLKPYGSNYEAFLLNFTNLNITKFLTSYYETVFLGKSVNTVAPFVSSEKASGDNTTAEIKKYFDVLGFDLSFLPETNLSSIIFSQFLRSQTESIFIWAIQLKNLSFIVSRCYEKRVQSRNYFVCKKIFRNLNLTKEIYEVLDIYNGSFLNLGLRFQGADEIRLFNYKTMQPMRNITISGIGLTSNKVSLENGLVCVAFGTEGLIKIFSQNNLEPIKNISSSDFLNLVAGFFPNSCRIINEARLFMVFDGSVVLANIEDFLAKKNEKIIVIFELMKSKGDEAGLINEHLYIINKGNNFFTVYFLSAGKFKLKNKIVIPEGERIEKYFHSQAEFEFPGLFYLFTKSASESNLTKCLRIFDFSSEGLNQLYLMYVLNGTISPFGTIAIDDKNEFLFWNISKPSEKEFFPALGKITKDPSIYMVLSDDFTSPASSENFSITLSTPKSNFSIALSIKYVNNRAEISIQPDRIKELDHLLTINDPAKDVIGLEVFNFSSGVVLNYDIDCYECDYTNLIRIMRPFDVYSSILNNIVVADIALSEKRIFIQAVVGIVVLNRSTNNISSQVIFGADFQCKFVVIDPKNDSNTISLCLKGFKSVLVFSSYSFNESESKVETSWLVQEVNVYNVKKLILMKNHLLILRLDGTILVFNVSFVMGGTACLLFKDFDNKIFHGRAENGIADFSIHEVNDSLANSTMFLLFFLGRRSTLALITTDEDLNSQAEEFFNIEAELRKQTDVIPNYFELASLDVTKSSSVFSILIGIKDSNSYEFRLTLNPGKTGKNEIKATAAYLMYSNHKTGKYLKILTKENCSESFVFQTVKKGSLVRIILYDRLSYSGQFSLNTIKSALSYDYPAEPSIYFILERSNENYFKILLADLDQKRLLNALAMRNITFIFSNSSKISAKGLNLKISNDENQVAQFININNQYWIDPPPEMEAPDQNKWVFGLLAAFIFMGLLLFVFARKLRTTLRDNSRESVIGDIMLE